MNDRLQPSATLPVTAYGWQRAPERDLPCAWAWELPGGGLVWYPSGWVPVLPVVAKRDAARGEPHA